MRGETFPWMRRTASLLAVPVVAWLSFNAVVFAWHVPLLYEVALRSPIAHAVEHLSFLAAAIVFWLPVLRPGVLGTRDGLVYLMAEGFASGALGLWLVVSTAVVYRGFDGGAELGALADQRLAGGVMLGPGAAVIGLAAGWLIYRRLGEMERLETSEARR
jgi:cytochrome c oxidase assembly factor CtaG